MTILTSFTWTLYRYSAPVSFGPHRLMMRPRDSHDLRLLDTRLSIQPSASVRWLHDVFGNSVAIAEFAERASELLVISSFRAEHYPLQEAGEPGAGTRSAIRSAMTRRRFPTSAARRNGTILTPSTRSMHGHAASSRNTLHRDTMAILLGMVAAIWDDSSYNWRDTMGTQDPLITLGSGGETCRTSLCS